MTNTQFYFYKQVPITYNLSEDEREKILQQFPVPELPQGDEQFNLENETQGNRIHVRLLVNDYQVQLTKTNKQFLKIRFSNNAGIINAKVWDNQGAVDRLLPELEKHTVFDVSGRVDEFNGFKSLTVDQLIPCEEDINPFSLLPYTKQDLEWITIELFSYLSELEQPYRDISFSAMTRFWNQFRIRPAAMGYHHNYLGGLLKHTVGLMRFARYVLKFQEDPFKATMKLIHIVEKAHKNELWAQIQNDENSQPLVWKDTIDHLYKMFYGMMQYKDTTPNYDLIMTSILFHDIGKILEYDHAGKTFEAFQFLFPTATELNFEHRKQAGITMDELGVMVGHIPYGVLFLTKVIEAENIQLSLEIIHLMSHCILCHHGLPEWGSAVRSPQTIEGYIIHIVDYLDSRYENTERIK
ncbi:HD domain-containing protein [Oceanobacillus senegalensis]|uniref:HD domain-containing protein n=1 Tax=Oceanobacillus senegalensis TaxID=1936063 RepID=UPI000A307013|nr:HD domain-containing protein [Oceanobacillus senegalensis]